MSARAPEPGPARTTGCIPLSDLPAGATGRLCRHPGAAATPARLADLGFVPDTAVRVLRHAPLGDPIEVELRGYRVCLRRADLARLCVVPEAAAP